MGKKAITIEFDDEELATGFATWLSDGGGEQSFMVSHEHHDSQGELTGVTFDYWQGTGVFMSTGKIVVKRYNRDDL